MFYIIEFITRFYVREKIFHHINEIPATTRAENFRCFETSDPEINRLILRLHIESNMKSKSSRSN